MKPYKKPKYKLDPNKLVFKKEEGIPEEEIFKEMQREKNKYRRR